MDEEGAINVAKKQMTEPNISNFPFAEGIMGRKGLQYSAWIEKTASKVEK